ncbi:MAG TPA: MBL fold metallo-hydrolase [Vicinamibacterales bacterium]
MMLVRRFFDERLAQASYLIGCLETKQALVVDANRDVDQYIRAADAEGLAITHVTETHIHADYVSGSRELAARTGARLYLSDEGDEHWKYAFAADANAVLLKDGDTFDVGSVRIQAVHTPGHTPEHLMFLVTDTSTADEPVAALTGDFIFVGDVGRPDLLERAANFAGTMVAGARTLFRSLKVMERYPDYLQIWPAHGAGSACGKGLGALPQSTLGWERRFNWAFRIDDEETFVQRVLEGQPDPPAYFALMKKVNKEGPALRGPITAPPRLPAARLDALLASGARVVDTRDAEVYAAGHVPGTINLPLTRAFTTWAGWLLPYTEDIYLIAEDAAERRIVEAVRELALIGLDRIAGWFGGDVLAGRELRTIEQVDARTAAARVEAGEVDVVDVRSRAEYDAGHMRGARHIPLGQLLKNLHTLPAGRPILVHCQGGTRSAIGASLLDAAGFTQVSNLTHGFREWMEAGLPVEEGTAQAAGAKH